MTSKENFVIAVPSKGRLQENAAAFFARAGLQVVQGRGVRDYRGTIAGMAGVEIAFLSASEIVSHLASGSVHMGVTGEDLIRENVQDASARVEILTRLGFGHANVVVAVPQAWIDVKTMADLEDVASAFRAKRGARMRVATKYINLTRTYFDRMGVADYRIVESLGATEGAPAAGQAEIIVDITTTGATLAANALKVLDDGIILRSEANLVASVNASWTDAMRETARRILSRIAAEEDARTSRQVRAVVAGPKARLIEEAAKTFAARAPFGATADGPLTFICPKAGVPALADWLVMQGAEHVTVETLDYIFGARNPLFDKLTARLT